VTCFVDIVCHIAQGRHRRKPAGRVIAGSGVTPHLSRNVLLEPFGDGSARLQIVDGSNQRQPCAHGSLCIVLVRLWIPEEQQDPITHVLRYGATPRMGRLDQLSWAAFVVCLGNLHERGTAWWG
jgi:hypothetical protein